MSNAKALSIISNSDPLVQDSEVKDLVRTPDEVLDDARRAAKALKGIIDQKAKKVTFNGKQYIEFEDWQTVAKFYGVSAKVESTRYVEFGEVKGFEARAVVVQVSTGQEISAADAMCLNDERNWKEKPLFQLKSMAQTRACAKALRNVLAWVVVLAGYNPTPAEELPDAQQEENKGPPPKTPSNAGFSTNPSALISDGQRKRLYAIYKNAGISDEEMQEFLFTHYGIKKGAEIKRGDYGQIVEWAENQGKKNPVPEGPSPDSEWPE